MAEEQITERKRPVVAQEVSAPISGVGTTKVIACKIPQGLRLIVRHFVEEWEATPAGPRQTRVHRPAVDPDSGEAIEFVVRGCARLQEAQLTGLVRDTGGYALTHGCPTEIWENWFSYNKSTPLVRNRMIEAFDTEQQAITWCLLSENRDLRSGLERIDPERPELTTGIRRTRSNQLGGVSGIERGGAS